MDENLHELDDLFKKALGEIADVPSANVWEKLEKDLEKRKLVSITRKYQKWKWVAAALFIFSFGMAMYTVSLKLKYKSVATGNKSVSGAGVKDKKQVKINSTISAAVADNKNIKARDDRNKTNDISANKATVKKSALAAPNKRQVITTTTAVEVKAATQYEKENKKLIAKAKVRDNYRNKIWKNTSDKHAKTPFANNNSSGRLNKHIEFKSIELTNKYNVEVSVATLPKKTFITGLPALNLKPVPNISTDQTVLVQNAASLKRKANPSFIASIFATNDIINNSLENERSGFREDDRLEIKNAEKASKGYTIGVTISKTVFKNISLLCGIGLSKRSTNINTKSLYARPDSRGNISYRISSSAGYAYFNANGGTSPRYGDSITSLSSKSTLQYISVPIGLQYQLALGKFSFNPQVAFISNFKTGGTISSVLRTQNGTETSPSNDIMGLKSSYFDAAVRLDLAYNFTNNLGIVMTPAYRLGLTSATKDGPVKNYVNSLGLGLGLNLNF